ncbi:hypothetical protein IQ07DRAFT_259123 [Pyrenochaeta sp. DS3sAY3a]|nr:hypothetical protein IQ07DRAFT_259123 [Pyrenochaeta sp. DS3sAY3a]
MHVQLLKEQRSTLAEAWALSLEPHRKTGDFITESSGSNMSNSRIDTKHLSYSFSKNKRQPLAGVRRSSGPHQESIYVRSHLFAKGPVHPTVVTNGLQSRTQASHFLFRNASLAQRLTAVELHDMPAHLGWPAPSEATQGLSSHSRASLWNNPQIITLIRL